MALSEKEKDEFKALLWEARTKILRENKEHFSLAKEKLSANDHSAISNHIAEAITENIRLEESLSKNCVKRLKKIDEAFWRLDDDTFGICSGCSQQIPIRRLQAVPFTEYCVGCKEAKEEKEVRGGLRQRSSLSRQLSAAYA